MKGWIQVAFVAAFVGAGLLFATRSSERSDFLPMAAGCYAGVVRSQPKSFRLTPEGMLQFENQETSFKVHDGKDWLLVLPDREFYIHRYGDLELADHGNNSSGFRLSKDYRTISLSEVTGAVEFSRVSCPLT